MGPDHRQELDINGALDALSDREFVVVWLHFFNGLSFAAIADCVQASKSSTYDVWLSARSKMAEDPSMLDFLRG